MSTSEQRGSHSVLSGDVHQGLPETIVINWFLTWFVTFFATNVPTSFDSHSRHMVYKHFPQIYLSINNRDKHLITKETQSK